MTETDPETLEIRRLGARGDGMAEDGTPWPSRCRASA